MIDANAPNSAPCWCGSGMMRLHEMKRNGTTTRCCPRCSSWSLLWSAPTTAAELQEIGKGRHPRPVLAATEDDA
jgi:hypothetical protein